MQLIGTEGMKTTHPHAFYLPFISKSWLWCLVSSSMLMLAASSLLAESIVLDYGPLTGHLTPREGLSSVWVNMSNGQNFADSVNFANDTTIVGYNLFTASSRLSPFINTFAVRLWSSNIGSPGSLLSEVDLVSTNVQFIGNLLTTAGIQTDVYQISLRFDPIVLKANQTYWIGASGLNHDIGTYGVLSTGDHTVVQMNGLNYAFSTTLLGDVCFQLVAIPEPSILGLSLFIALLVHKKRCGRLALTIKPSGYSQS